MGQQDRYLKIRAIHRTLPWTDIEVIQEARESVKNKFPFGATAYLDRLLERGASVATFEIYSPHWFLPGHISTQTKHELSVASVVSAAAIIAIDDLVDGQMQSAALDPALFDQARFWGAVAAAKLGVRTNWGRAIVNWSQPRHGISVETSANKIPLRKNPFYVVAALGYTRNTAVPGHRIASAYTSSLGTIDDILDLVDDFLGSRPNALLSALRLPPTAGIDDLLYRVVSRDMLTRYCRLSIKQMQRAKAMASASQCELLARTCQVYEEKFSYLLAHVNANFVASCSEARTPLHSESAAKRSAIISQVDIPPPSCP